MSRTVNATVASLRPSKDNRKIKDVEPSFVDSIKRHGVMQPILVREVDDKPGEVVLEIIAGERRWRAAMAAKLETVPVRIMQVDESKASELRLVENIQRKNLTPLEEARQIAAMKDKLGCSWEDAGATLGIHAHQVRSRVQLLKLAPPIQKMLDQDKLTVGVAEVIARVPNPKVQAEFAKAAGRNHYRECMTVVQAKDLFERSYAYLLKEASFPTAEPTPSKKNNGIPCTACPFNTATDRLLFQEMKLGKKALCLDPTCWEDRTRIAGARAVKAAKEKGKVVVDGKKLFNKYGQVNTKAGYTPVDETVYVKNKPRKVSGVVQSEKLATVQALDPDGKLRTLVRTKDLERTTKAKTSHQSEEEADRKHRREVKVIYTAMVERLRDGILKHRSVSKLRAATMKDLPYLIVQTFPYSTLQAFGKHHGLFEKEEDKYQPQSLIQKWLEEDERRIAYFFYWDDLQREKNGLLNNDTRKAVEARLANVGIDTDEIAEAVKAAKAKRKS